MTPHPTLRISDVLRRRAQSLRAHHAPQALYLTFSARAALYQFLLSLQKEAGDTILLPAYHCTALVEPVVRAGFHTSFYRICPDFRPDLEDLRAKVTLRTAAVVVVHFFGFPVDLSSILKTAEQHGSYVVEDCAHSFLSRSGNACVGHQGDFALYSYYKFAPSLTGGGLGINRSGFTLLREPTQVPLLERAVIAKRLIEQAAANSPQNLLSRTFLWAEERRGARKNTSAEKAAVAPSAFVDDPYVFREDLARAAMPGICQRILESCDWEEIARARRRNYQVLGGLLRDTPEMKSISPKLPDDVVPWAFPVLFEDRVRHEQILRRLGVPLFTFGEVLHSELSKTRDHARDEAEALSKRLLLLPVHANLTEADVASYGKILMDYVNGIQRGKMALHDDELMSSAQSSRGKSRA